MRDGDLLPNTHTIIERNDSVDGGNDDGGLRIYTVVKGAHPGSGTLAVRPALLSPFHLSLAILPRKSVPMPSISLVLLSTTLRQHLQVPMTLPKF